MAEQFNPDQSFTSKWASKKSATSLVKPSMLPTKTAFKGRYMFLTGRTLQKDINNIMSLVLVEKHNPRMYCNEFSEGKKSPKWQIQKVERNYLFCVCDIMF